MNTRQAAKSIPRAPLIGGLALLLVTLGVTDFFGLIGDAGAASRGGTMVLSHTLRFEDRADGGVLVRNAETGAVVETLEPTTNGFLRGTLRALTRERKKDQIGRAIPFRLTSFSDGRLTLEDPATGERIALEAFGDTNKEVFVNILLAAEARR